MNSIFLRIYGGMLAALVLVAVLGVLSLHLLNEVRAGQYRERLAHGTFTLMADNLAPLDAVERKRALLIWERLLGIPLELQALSSTALDGSQRSGLQRGQVLVEKTGPHAAKVLRQVGDQDLLLVGEVQQISEQLARATIYLLADELVRYPVAEQPQRLAALKQSKGFGFDLRLQRVNQTDMDEDQRRRIDEGDTVMALGKDGDSIRVFAGLVGTPWVLEIGPLYQMNPYPPQLLVLIAVLGLCLIGLIVYLLVRQLERRLSGLEAAATLIAQGSLETRVAADDADSVGRLAAAFNGMAEHLQRSLTIQRELVRAVSHELRTPVARLRFGLEMIASASNDQARDKYLTGMDGDIQDLDKLVDEMLTYARLEQGAPALHFQRVDLDALLDQVIAELAPLRREVRVLRGPCQGGEKGPDGQGPWVEAEPRYLHRALQNLVSNAMRHAESQVSLSYQLGLQRCRIDVEDDGPGVPESVWERIFTPFTRLDDSRTRASGGHGLGLSIVRRIIYWHGGRASVGRSERLGGACFSLNWPRNQDGA
ncbi:ATP-binding protein [Pseudomonas sp. NPDC087612]|uniref:histidine kinase n=1 Tax=Pseudomonas vranovensis TaxID=321661 RepID=A0A423D475_9PSED|nr:MULTISPECIES: ATP-binding protein [Pseudomonas]KJK19683.1 histidine kinase [Pseudomonas sp. 2(2015)]QPG63280.1 HAMP domain-containing protein [Pseudomonas sp. BIGb0427]ROL66359.1 two-component sensor histidine kinase [Pseudomonas vranovensis]UVM54741.1 HAMP domain-containing protein [Pseudomonas sp. B21-012]UVM65725.1 HAMP domain-containing protein [Pseudomonas sp. B21-009]